MSEQMVSDMDRFVENGISEREATFALVEQLEAKNKILMEALEALDNKFLYPKNVVEFAQTKLKEIGGLG